VLEEALEETLLSRQPVRFAHGADEETTETRHAGEVYSDADSAEVEARLAGLGYLS